MTMTMLNFDEIKRRLEESRAKPLLERTQFTEAAHRNAIASVRAAKASGEIHTPVEMASDEGALWVFANGYLTENRGQPCATRGLQGAHPDWIALLRDLGVPVRIVFWQPPSWWQVWLDRGEPPVEHISDAPGAHKRLGWYVGKAHGASLVPYPREAPPLTSSGLF